MLGAFSLGALFAAGWSPCVGPILGTILTYGAATGSSHFQMALSLFIYGAGLSAPLIVIAGLAPSLFAKLRKLAPHSIVIEKILGAGMVAVALFMMMGQNDALSPSPVLMDTDQKASNTETLKSQNPAILELYSKDCPICRAMEPIIEGISQECALKRTPIVRKDVSLPENRALISQYQLKGVPTFLFYDESGQEIARLIGAQTDQALRQALSAARKDNGLCFFHWRTTPVIYIRRRILSHALTSLSATMPVDFENHQGSEETTCNAPNASHQTGSAFAVASSSGDCGAWGRVQTQYLWLRWWVKHLTAYYPGGSTSFCFQPACERPNNVHCALASALHPVNRRPLPMPLQCWQCFCRGEHGLPERLLLVLLLPVNFLTGRWLLPNGLSLPEVHQCVQ
jgi:thiol-disulfide isomerase/thioredoxin